MAVPSARAVELERFERTFNLTRVGGAAITFALGPLFPNIGLAHVVLFGTLLLAQAALVTYVLRAGRLRRDPEGTARVILGIDLALISYAIALFSYDPNWTTYIVGLLVVIAGGFRFAGPGALLSAVVMASAYVAAALYREREYGFATEPQRIAFTVTIYLLAGLLMSGLLRELTTLRAQRERFERQRAETEALREVDRLKSDFLAAMSHDFRSPLTVVRGGLELLLSEGPGALNAGQRVLATSAERNVRRLEEFAEDLVELARIEHGALALDREELDACELVRDVVADHAELAARRSQALRLECDGAALISADATSLRRAVGNLIANAVKYAPEGTPIAVRTSRDGDTFRVSVTDRGPGVDEDERERIFEKFSRGRRNVSVAGAGLGLAIARSLAELHGGTLRYEDAPGGGATFTMVLPLGMT